MSVGAKVLKSLPALFGVQAMQYVIPLLTIPFLLRVLGLDGWGRLALLMSFLQLAVIPLEYGFHISATQAAAHRQDDPQALARLFGAVTAAKLLIALVLAVPLYGLALLLPHVGADRALPAWALLAAILQAQDPLWFFLGTERPNRIAMVTILARLAALGGMVALMRGPDDGWIYFLCQALAWLCVLVTGIIWAHRQTGFSLRHIRAPRQVLKDGIRIFQLYLGSNVFDMLLPIVLGAVTSPAIVGLFVGADKLARAVVSLLGPFRTALFPRMTALMRESRAEAARLWRWALLRVGGLSVVISLTLFLAADIVVRHFLGPEAVAAADILRVLCLFPPLVVLNSILGVQWMIPVGQEATLRNAYIATGCLRLAICALLGGEQAAYGAALANILAELIVLATCGIRLQRVGMAPWLQPPVAPIMTSAGVQKDE